MLDFYLDMAADIVEDASSFFHYPLELPWLREPCHFQVTCRVVTGGTVEWQRGHCRNSGGRDLAGF